MDIYIDVLFLVNFIANYIIMLSTAKVAGIYIKRRYIIYSSVFGSFVSLIIFFMKIHMLILIIIQLLCAFIMIYIAFGKNNKESFLRLTVLFIIITTAFAGICTFWQNFANNIIYRNGVVYMDLPFKMLVLSFGISYFIISVVFGKSARHNIKKGELATVDLSAFGNNIKFSALNDTGNDLKDPITGKKVIIIERNIAMQILPSDLTFIGISINESNAVEMLERIGKTTYNTKFRIINYNSIGAGDASLLIFNPERVISGGKQLDVYIGISPNKISNGAYNAIV